MGFQIEAKRFQIGAREIWNRGRDYKLVQNTSTFTSAKRIHAEQKAGWVLPNKQLSSENVLIGAKFSENMEELKKLTWRKSFLRLPYLHNNWSTFSLIRLGRILLSFLVAQKYIFSDIYELLEWHWKNEFKDFTNFMKNIHFLISIVLGVISSLIFN